MASIMADHNVEGHFVVLLRLWTSDVWRTVWESLELEVESFERLGLPYTSQIAICGSYASSARLSCSRQTAVTKVLTPWKLRFAP
jgi:hypothetical protein